ncbi:MAG: hypothetical protein KC493_17550, partial [Bacteriovoracaceae bacterium]|nr:hypothetical protein [Bacteriovoracaceae bacterium]
MRNILGFILCGVLLISCSDFDVEQFKAVYEEQCQESRSVSLDAIKEGATCNGVPLLIALVRADDYRINSDLHKIIRYLVNNRGFVLNKKSKKGLSLLQESLIHNKIKVAELILTENTPFISKTNKNNNVLHTVLNHTDLQSSKIALEIAQKFDGDLNELNLDGVSPLEEAYQKGFGSIVFTLISRGVSEDYILEKMLAGEMKPEVLFVNEIEKAREFIRLA